MTHGFVTRKLGWVFVAATVFMATPGFARPRDSITSDELTRRLNDLKIPEPKDDSRPVEEEMSALFGCPRTRVKLDVFDPITKTDKAYAVTVVRPKSGEKPPVVIVVPSIEGTTPLEPSMAYQFCSAGMATVIADVVDTTWPVELPSWGVEDSRHRMAVMAIRHLVNFAESDPRFDRNRIGLLGVSLGGIVSSMVAGIEGDRLKGIVITVGGGNLPAILAASTNRKVADFRRRRMAAGGLKTPDDYEEELHKTVLIDPFYFAPAAKTDRLLMIMAEGDTTVPYAQQKEQFEAFGQPNSILFSGGHIPTILSLVYWHFDKVTDFFKARFAEEPRVEEHQFIVPSEAESEAIHEMMLQY